MAKILILAEKPSVGREIARVLGCRRSANGYIEGDRYIVTWALGHLVTLADPDAYDKKYEKWEMADLPMLPDKMKLVVIKETGGQFRTVQALMNRKDVTELVIATDSGREGELVARWIMMKASWRGTTRRLWISSQTDKAIKEGFANLRPAAQYDNLFRSAQARSQADWLVGLNVTRALTCRFNAQLSAGRVQTPTLALIVEREREIRSFSPKDYWGVRAKFEGFEAVWQDEKGRSRTFDQSLAETVAAACANGTGTITQLSRTYKNTPPPAAYDLTELQRDANRKYAYSAKETLSIMQSLYETHKLLTYPRTDSRYISDDVVSTLPERLRSVMVEEYRPLAQAVLAKKPLQTRFLVNNAKVTDHHAIIPTEEQAELWRLSGPERNVYDLVVRRFLAVLMPAFEYEEVRLSINVSGKTFVATGKIVKEKGWHGAYSRDFSFDEEEVGEERSQALPELRQGERIKVLSSRVSKGQTSPPARYTEATLLTAMEHPATSAQDRAGREILEQTGGLGTPATRADIIEKLFSSFYVERQGKSLVPSSKGMQLIEIVPQDLRFAELTAQWETRLSKIATGAESDEKFVGEMRKYAARLVSDVRASEAIYRHDNQTKQVCPDCGKYLLKVKGKRGEMLVCPDRECGYRKNLSQTTNARCPSCHKKMELRGEGERQQFVCVCGYREKMADFQARRAKDGGSKSDVRKYLETQSKNEDKSGGDMAEQMAKWLESQGK